MSNLQKNTEPRDGSSRPVTITRRQFNKALGAGVLMTVGVADVAVGQAAKAKVSST